MVLDDSQKDLVSIIMPTYNCEKFIEDSIKSVLDQTYKNWELLIIDDFSTDNTEVIVNKYLKNDSRIKYYKLNVNSGAAIARNKAMELAKGTFVAYLDSDDLWTLDKLEKQIKFMKDNQYNFTCTTHDQIDENNNPLNIIIKAKEKANYHDVLLTCPIGNSTVIYNAEVLGKFTIPDIKKSNDYVLWLQILKKEKYVYGLNEILGSWRNRHNSLSKNKISKVAWHWYIYRNIENLSLNKSIGLICLWGLLKIFRINR